MASDCSATLTELSAALVALSATVSPLLDSSLEELVENGIAPLDKAKLQVTMAYVVHDLVWIYLKSTGIDPSTHPVMTELDRVKSYFAKISSAERKDDPRPSIDKEAAGRFIRAAIGSGAKNAIAGPSTHTRFAGEVDKLLADHDNDDEAEEEMELEKEAQEIIIDEKQSSKPVVPKRAKMDPFAGYDSPKAQTKKKQKKEKRTRVEDADAEIVADVQEEVTAAIDTIPLSKKQRKLAFKKAKEAAGATI